MKKFKLLLGVLFAALLFVIGFLVVAYRVMYLPVPNYDEEIEVDGLKSVVKVYRDSLAIPYIIANNETDASFALGYVHAQDRMFQMDLMRRAAEGKLSEVFGSKTIPFDKMFRTVGLRRIIDSHYPHLSDVTKSMLIAYSNGVNEYLKNNSHYSFEFDILGYNPELWRPEHSLLIAKLMAWELNISWWTDIMFSHLVQKFGVQKAAEILPGFDENAPTIIPNNYNNVHSISLEFIKTDKYFREFMNMNGTHIGSNNWVINHNKSKSGKVIIANDPHLAFALPGKWFVAVVRSNEWNVEGFTLPGVPAVVIGKNESIAWALTNVMTDDADFYIEELDSSASKYLLDGEWLELSVIEETINVKDSSDIKIQVKSTHRGPIISNIHAYNVLYPDSSFQNKSIISMRWTAQEFSDEYNAIYSINKAQNWTQFETSVQGFTVPGQNFVYGDNENNIGYICAAKLPIRNSVSSTLIYDGTTSLNDWKGFVDYKEMPKLFNPIDNYIASANNKTIADFKYHISNIWEPSSRIERIQHFLNKKEQLSVKDYADLQNDFYSNYAKKITKRFLSAFENTNVTDKNMLLAIKLLKEWDFVMDKDQQAPSVYLVMYQKLLENIFKDEMGENLFKEYIFIANVPYRIIEEVSIGKNISWIDDVTTSKVESFNDIIRRSLVDALEELEKNFGKDIADWQWYKLHSVTLKHPFDGISPMINKIVNVGPHPISGSGTTIFNTEYSFTNPYDVKLGPSMRYIFDFGSPDEFNFAMPSGQSGHVMSEHYDNTTEYWLKGNYTKLNINTESISDTTMELLILK